MVTELTIARCGDCPFFDSDDDWYDDYSWCDHPGAPEDERFNATDSGPVHAWCPLRSGPTVVKLSEKGEI